MHRAARLRRRLHNQIQAKRGNEEINLPAFANIAPRTTAWTKPAAPAAPSSTLKQGPSGAE